jgi:hypothetical protein
MNEGVPSPVFFPEDEAVPPIVPVVRKDRIDPYDRVAERFHFGDLVDEPVFEGQADRYPDSVVETDLRFVQIRTDQVDDQAKYSQLQLSTRVRGSKIILWESPPQWDPAHGVWHVLLKVSTRKFRTLTTARTDKSETNPQTQEAVEEHEHDSTDEHDQ